MKQIQTWKLLLNWVLVSLTLGAGITSMIESNSFWQGMISTTLLIGISIGVLYLLHRYARGGKTLAWMMLVAFTLRLGIGIWLMQELPVQGYPTDQQKAGYVFFDAFKRDTQAYNLAKSEKPVISTFTKRYASDQYGGYLALSMLVYRYLSPDTHRPILMLILSALAGAAVIPFFWLLAKRFLSRSIAVISAWIIVLFPQGVLMGASQMREAWISLFMVIGFWSFLEWISDTHSRKIWLLGIGLVGLLLLSPGFIFLLLILLIGWWVLEKRKKPIPLWAVITLIIFVVTGVLILSYGLSRPDQTGNDSPIEVIINWFRNAIAWDMRLSATGSGRLSYLFETLPVVFQFPFILVYGILQPVLPAAILDDARWIWNLISSILAAGWYLLLPLLIYAVFAVRSEKDERLRAKLIWITVLSWLWIIISSARAGGDQWDNPRYRVIMLPWMAIICSWAWMWAQEQGRFWLNRILLCEGVFLLVFTQWYVSRYLHIFSRLDLKVMILLIFVLMAVILATGWWKEHRRKKLFLRKKNSIND